MVGLLVIATLFLGVGVWIIRKQACARDCPLHDHRAGVVALGLGWMAIALAVALFIAAITVPI